MVPTEDSELKHRKIKKVAADEISMVPIQTLSESAQTISTKRKSIGMQC